MDEPFCLPRARSRFTPHASRLTPAMNGSLRLGRIRGIDIAAHPRLALALCSLIPAFPLHGGRILRSATWAVTGNLLRATRIATLIGQMVGYAFIVWGAYRILVAHDFVSGLWTAFIGWFLQNAAEGTYR